MAGACRVEGRISFDLAREDEEKKRTEKIAESLSGIAWEGGCVFLGSDEGPGLERLVPIGGEGGRYGGRVEYPLKPLFDLEGDKDDEADIESLAADGGWLWLVTSHALTRKKLKDDADDLTKIEHHPRRYVLGRVPLARRAGEPPEPARKDEGRKARHVRQTDKGSALTDALGGDPHLGRSLLLPAKETGLDVEGLAVDGERVVLGLRGPVLRGQWAVLLDLLWSASGDQDAPVPLMKRDGSIYRKSFMEMDGLGVRDLCKRGEDLLILAGPTIPVPAPYRVYAVPGFFKTRNAPSVVERGGLRLVCDVPSDEGNPEGISVYPGEASGEVLAMVLDGAEAENRTRARALLIRAP